MSLNDLIQEARGVTGIQEEKPADVERYYKDCRKKSPNKGKEYCARVAWQIYCTNKNPDYPGCTKYGKTGATKGPLAQSKHEDCGCGS
jgi:hypothetical protein